MDVEYSVLYNDEKMLAIRFFGTLNAGGSGEYTRCFTLDKRTGKVLELKDLFLDTADYVGNISQEILRQMELQVNQGTGDYFIPGGIWSEEECFHSIDQDQDFYISQDGKLVIVFEEYEVAPGRI